MPDFSQALRLFAAPENRTLLTGIKRGIEKESLRVTPSGQLARTPHPRGLGSPLTNPRITTDFSEALIELITPPLTRTDELFRTLEEIHSFSYNHLGDELLWASSMPCALGEDDDIPIARYGDSNVGRMKEIYRLGLGHRYGRRMQTIAGIHYNWSLPDVCFSVLQTASGNGDSFQSFKTEAYFGLIRNFRRHTWLLLYLFGAAPAVCKTFVEDRPHRLVPLDDDPNTLHAPHATSLRMGDLGYQSSAQETLRICYNGLDTYTQSLRQGLATSYPDYEAVGVRDAAGEYQQLNSHLLQIENEFYSTVRPKRTTRSGETPLKALLERGVEYVEVRCLDLNPYVPLGIDARQVAFLDVFLLHCLLAPSPDCNEAEYEDLIANQKETVYEGRNPDFRLRRGSERPSVREWGGELLNEMAPVADLLDAAFHTRCHAEALATMRERLADPALTPSAQILETLREENLPYFRWALRQSRRHRDYFAARPLPDHAAVLYREMAEKSLADQADIEASDNRSFEDYLASYYAQHGAPVA